jgi:hypothetical protein
MSTEPVNIQRRTFCFQLFVTAAAATVLVSVAPSPVEAKPWRTPPGWSRGRKRGWSKRGGPKWR